MSDYVRSLLSAEQEQALVDAISQAELNTSGEIRIHLEKSTGNSSAEQRAKQWAAWNEYYMSNPHLTPAVRPSDPPSPSS